METDSTVRTRAGLLRNRSRGGRGLSIFRPFDVRQPFDSTPKTWTCPPSRRPVNGYAPAATFSLLCVLRIFWSISASRVSFVSFAAGWRGFTPPIAAGPRRWDNYQVPPSDSAQRDVDGGGLVPPYSFWRPRGGVRPLSVMCFPNGSLIPSFLP